MTGGTIATPSNSVANGSTVTSTINGTNGSYAFDFNGQVRQNVGGSDGTTSRTVTNGYYLTGIAWRYINKQQNRSIHQVYWQ